MTEIIAVTIRDQHRQIIFTSSGTPADVAADVAAEIEDMPQLLPVASKTVYMLEIET